MTLSGTNITIGKIVNQAGSTFNGDLQEKYNVVMTGYVARNFDGSLEMHVNIKDVSGFKRMMDKYHFIRPQVNMKVNLHSLRHTFATRCIESGMQAKVLQHILGHKDNTTTYNIYGDVFDRFEFDNIVAAEQYMTGLGLSPGMSA